MGALPSVYDGAILPYHPDPQDLPRKRWVKRWLRLTRRFARTIDFESAHGPMRGLRADFTVTAKYLRTQQWHGALDGVFAALARTGAASIDTLVNVGANNGCTVLPALKHGFAKRAIALEPEPQNAALLAHNIKAHGLAANITVLPVAAGAEDGELGFEISPTNKGDHRLAGIADDSNWRKVRVPVRRLDDVVAPLLTGLPPSSVLTWMDIQGAEPMAIAGGRALFTAFPLLIAEFNPRAMARLSASRDDVAALYATLWNRMMIGSPNGEWTAGDVAQLAAFWDELGETGREADLMLWRA